MTIVCISKVGQNHMYMVYIQYFLQGFHQMYGHIRKLYTVLANPKYSAEPSTYVVCTRLFLLH